MLRSCLNILLSNELNNLPVVIDLFSGCGGLSFGFKTAGFRIEHGLDLSESASQTASYNLYWRFGIDKKHICGDIRLVSPNNFKEGIKRNGCIVIGGPPCQAYSRIGKAKLRSLGDNRIHTNDERGYLFQDFLRFAIELNAAAVVMENVPEAIDYGGLNIPQHVCEILEQHDYEAYWTILNAADYGVPQIRERVFVLAIKNSVEHDFDLPVPTHKGCGDKAPPFQLRMKKYSEYKNFRQPNSAPPNSPQWVTVGEALSDLPVLFPDARAKYHLYKPNIQLNYRSEPTNSFQYLMRNWFDRETKTVTGHGFRRTVRDFPIFERMKQGDDFRAASEIAEELLDEACRAENINKENHPDLYEKLRKNIVPPYDKSKFLTKWKKLNENKPSHTLVAHLSTDTYSHLHPWEPRGISVREAARLQSFPDDFLFLCNMGDAFKQIGNAVPPLLSKAIAIAMRKNLLKGGS